MKRHSLRVGMVSAVLIAITGIAAMPASAQEEKPQRGIKAGYLNCQVARGWGLIFGSSKSVKCVYSPKAGVHEQYNGSISKFGVDIGYSTAGVMLWSVVAPTSDIGKGDLAGTYAGATAGGSLGVGGGVNVLVGGFDESIALQPVSIEENNGLNLAAGVATLTLDPAP